MRVFGQIRTLQGREQALAHAPHLSASVENLRGALLWLIGLFGALVFVKPSPYEIAALLTIVVFMRSGIKLRSALMPFAVLLILYDVGFALAVVPVLDEPKSLLWVLVSCYLRATALFFAVIVGENTERRSCCAATAPPRDRKSTRLNSS